MAWETDLFRLLLVGASSFFCQITPALQVRRAAAGGLTVGTVAGHVNQSKLQDRPPLLRTSNRT